MLNFEHDPLGGHPPLTITGTPKILARFNPAGDNVEDSSCAEYYSNSLGRLFILTGTDIAGAPISNFTGDRMLLQTSYDGLTGFGNIRAVNTGGIIWIQANTNNNLYEDCYLLLNSVGKGFAIVIAHQDGGTKDMQFSADLATQTFTFSQNDVPNVILKANNIMQLQSTDGVIQAKASAIQTLYNDSVGGVVDASNVLTGNPTYGNAQKITGPGAGTAIDLINTDDWQQGSIMHLIFTGSTTVNGDIGSSGADIQIGLNNENSHTFVADEQLTLILAGDYWLEIGRRIKPFPLPSIIFTVNENFDFFQVDNDGSDIIIDWGDGSPLETITGGAAIQPSHTYVSPGSYQILVYNNFIDIFQIAPDDIGCNDQYLESVEQLHSSIVTCLISFNQNVTDIDVSALTNCTSFDGSYNAALTTFDTTGLTSCISFYMVNCDLLTTINSAGLTASLLIIVINNNVLVNFDFSNLSSCEQINFTDNIIFDQAVDFSALTNCTGFAFNGNLAFNQAVDFSALTNCTQFQFTLNSAFDKTVDFSALTNCINFGFDDNTSFNQTIDISGLINCDGFEFDGNTSFDLPLDFSILTNCTQFEFAFNSAFDQTVDFSALTNCASFRFSDNDLFDQTVDFSALTNCTSFNFSDNAAFAQPLDINLASITTLDITGNTLLDTLNLDGCTGITTIDLTGTPAITNFSADGLTSLTSIDTANLTNCLSFNAPNNPALATLDLTPMVNVISVQVYNCDTLAALDTTGLAFCQQFQCYNSAALATLDCNGLISCVTFDARNCILDVTNVNNALIDIDAAGTLNGDFKIENQTPVAIPTGAGATAKANLIVNGWTVTTD